MVIHSKKKSSNYSVIVGILIILVVIALSAATLYSLMTKESLNSETLCPTTGPKGHYVILIDNTSPFPYTQKASLSQGLKNIVRNELPEGYLLSVFLLGEDVTKNDKPLFERCSPGQWGNKSQLTSNKKFVERDFYEKFSKPLDEVVKKISLEEHSKKSPVFEMLQLVGINGFEHSDVIGEKKLIIYSDMLANTQEFSMYKEHIPSYENFSKVPYAQRALAPGLKDVSVSLNLISDQQQSGKSQKTRLISFWEKYFDASGASIESVQFLEGL